MSSEQRIAVFACVRLSWDAADIARYAERAEEVAWALTHQRRLFFLHTDITVDDPLFDILVDADPSDHPNYCGAAISEYRQQNPDEPFTHYHLLGGDRMGSSVHPGYGTRGKSVFFDPWAGMDLHGHEANGHGIGIMHMGRIVRPGAVSDYGGYGVGSLDGEVLPHNHPYSYLRLIDSERVAENHSCVLYPIENHSLEAGLNDQLLKLTDSDRNDYYLAWRQWHGKARIGARYALVVEARYRRPIELGKTKTIALDPLPLGEERLIGDHWVRFEEIRHGAARVSVRHKSEHAFDPVPAQVHGFANPAPAHRLQAEHSGLWYHPSLTGQGFDVLIVGDKVRVGWYTYADRKGGGQRWYVMEGQLQGGATAMDVFRSDGYRLETIGRAHLTTIGQDRLFMQWDTEVHGRMSLALQSLRPFGRTVQDDGITGAWHDPDKVYQGLRAYSFGDRVLAYYYGYGPVAPPRPHQPIDPYTAHRWGHYNLTRQSDGSFSGQVYRPTGGLFMYPSTFADAGAPEKQRDPKGIKLGPPGSAQLRLDDDSLVVNEASGQRILERLP